MPYKHKLQELVSFLIESKHNLMQYEGGRFFWQGIEKHPLFVLLKMKMNLII